MVGDRWEMPWMAFRTESLGGDMPKGIPSGNGGKWECRNSGTKRHEGYFRFAIVFEDSETQGLREMEDVFCVSLKRRSFKVSG